MNLINYEQFSTIKNKKLNNNFNINKIIYINLDYRTDRKNEIENELKKMSKLQYLNIIGTRIDDAGLMQLCEMGSLKNIYCWGSKVTPNGVENCKKKYPKVKIDNGDDNILVKK
jgi:hypothetical protein